MGSWGKSQLACEQYDDLHDRYGHRAAAAARLRPQLARARDEAHGLRVELEQRERPALAQPALASAVARAAEAQRATAELLEVLL